jgi:Lrp/AsnC family leucine-responsive transcriptional regulator
MKLGLNAELDAIDLQILSMLQEHCKTPLAKLGEQVGLSAPSVIERIKKLEDSGIITGYHATVDARRLGKDVTAFIGVSISHPKLIGRFESTVAEMDDVLECHHVTGEHSLLLKVKTDDTAALESLISTIRFIEGVSRTETMVVLSTHTERVTVALPPCEGGDSGNNRRLRHPGPRVGLPPKRA